MKKRLFLIPCLLTLFLFSALLAGCSSTAQTGKTAGESQETNSKSEEKAPLPQDLLAKGKSINEMSFDSESRIGEQTMHAKTWIKANKMRSEIDNPEEGGKIVNIIDNAAGVAYVYLPEQKIATKMDISMSQQDGSSSPQENLDAMKPEKMKYIGKDTVDGKMCLVYEYTEDNAGTAKVWLWEENGLPLRIESIHGGEKAVMEYRNLKIEGVPDSMFELPSGTEITEFNFPTMPKP